MKRLSLARKTMDDMNKELKHINGDLQELNARLQESNRVNARIGSKGDCVIPLSLEDNVTWLHQFLFDDSSYEPSDDVKRCSEQIYNETNGYIKK